VLVLIACGRPAQAASISLNAPGDGVIGMTFQGAGSDYQGSDTVSISSMDNVVADNVFQGCYYSYSVVSIAGDRAIVSNNTFNLEACSPKSTTQGIYAHAAFGTNIGTIIQDNSFHITDAGGFVRYPIHVFDQGHKQETTDTKLIADMKILDNDINCEGGCAGAIMVANGGSAEGAKVINIRNIEVAYNVVNLPIIVRSCNADSTINGVYIHDNVKPDGTPAEVRIDTQTCKSRGVIKNVYVDGVCIAPDGCDGIVPDPTPVPDPVPAPDPGPDPTPDPTPTPDDNLYANDRNCRGDFDQVCGWMGSREQCFDNAYICIER
jgi:hypothetical protein